MRLPLAKIAWGTFAFPWMYRGAFARALSLPLLALLACTMAWSIPGETNQGPVSVLHVLYLLAFSWLAIRCHRLVLTGSHRMDEAPRAFSMLGLFAITVIMVWILQTLVKLALTAGLLAMVSTQDIPPGASQPPAYDPDVQRLIDRVAFFAGIVGLYPVARLAALFPAISLGEKWNAAGAWRLTRRNGWRLVVLVFLLPDLFRELVKWLYSNDPGAFEFAIVVLSLGVITSLGVVALSLAYRELAVEFREPGPPPTRPPS